MVAEAIQRHSPLQFGATTTRMSTKSAWEPHGGSIGDQFVRLPSICTSFGRSFRFFGFCGSNLVVQIDSLFLGSRCRSIIDHFVLWLPHSSLFRMQFVSFSLLTQIFPYFAVDAQSFLYCRFLVYLHAFFLFLYAFRFYSTNWFVYFLVCNTKPWKIISTNYICRSHCVCKSALSWSANPIFICCRQAFVQTTTHDDHTDLDIYMYTIYIYIYICLYCASNAIKCIHAGSAHSQSQPWNGEPSQCSRSLPRVKITSPIGTAAEQLLAI